MIIFSEHLIVISSLNPKSLVVQIYQLNLIH